MPSYLHFLYKIAYGLNFNDLNFLLKNINMVMVIKRDTFLKYIKKFRYICNKLVQKELLYIAAYKRNYFKMLFHKKVPIKEIKINMCHLDLRKIWLLRKLVRDINLSINYLIAFFKQCIAVINEFFLKNPLIYERNMATVLWVFSRIICSFELINFSYFQDFFIFSLQFSQ